VTALGNAPFSPKIAEAAELWLRPSEEISAAEIGRVVGLSMRTLYNRLGPRDVARQSADPDEIDIAKTNEPNPWESRRTKPEGIPMMPEIIIEAISHALRDGRAGLKVSELIEFVRQRYWPEAPANSVGPVAWKMSKTGELQTIIPSIPSNMRINRPTERGQAVIGKELKDHDESSRSQIAPPKSASV